MADSRIVFLDRDGTVNVERGYITRPEEIELIPGSAAAIRSLKQAGYLVVVVSNQSAIGRGLVKDPRAIDATNRELETQLKQADAGAKLDGIFFCPHLPDDNCNCRKPKTGMVQSLVGSSKISIRDSWVVGDKKSDLDFGKNLGIPDQHRIMVLTGHGRDELERLRAEMPECELPVHCDSLPEAAAIILSD